MPFETYASWEDETWELQLPLLNRAWAAVQTAYGEQRYNIIEDALRLSAPNVVKRQTRRRLPRKHRWPLLERGRRCFLDVGGWHGNPDGIARTDFGLVSGQTVLLCSWLNMEGEVRGRKQYDWYCRKNSGVKFSQKIIDFFDMQKGAILGHFEFSEPVVNGDKLIIFLPDLHLHLCKETVIDNFTYNRNFGAKGGRPKIVSYQWEMRDIQHQARAAEAFGVSRPLTYDHVDQFGVPVDDTYTGPTAPKSQVDVIRERIMANYKNIFDNKNLKTDEIGMPFRWLRGTPR
jgi:hypothetical protein